MSGWVIDPTSTVTLVVGVGALVVWLWFAPPHRSGLVRGSLRGAAALLFAGVLLGVGCERDADLGSGRVIVLVDRSRSMEVPDESATRATLARDWLDSPVFEDWSAGWRIEIDSFGGWSSDIGAALDAAETTLPDAIVLVSDGRAARGRAAEAGAIPIFAWRPEPVRLVDAAVVDLAVETDESEGASVVIEVAASGGIGVPADGEVEVLVDDLLVARESLPALEAGERFVFRVGLPPATSRPAVVTATVSAVGDRVVGNDRRSTLWESAPDTERTVVLGLRAGWDLAPFLRALRAETGDVDVFVVGPESELRSPDGAGSTSWATLAVRRYGVAYVFGDPEALDPAGEAWLDRFAAAGGKGVYWAPGRSGGRLAGGATTVPARGARVEGSPELTLEGAAWLTARGFAPRAAPDGSAAWPPIEALPGRSPDVPGEATVLLSIGDRPIAWAFERGTTRRVVALGVGYYRWAIEGVTRAETRGREFWDQWVGATSRWLAAATPAERVAVRIPAEGRVGIDAPLRATLAGDPGAGAVWRVERTVDGERQVVERGEISDSGALSEIVAGPFEAGFYALVVEVPSAGWIVETPFLVDTWNPDLAWTEADTTSLGMALAASGGAWIDAESPPLPRSAGGATSLDASRRVGLATSPWPLLVGIVLVLADWALALTGRRTAG